MLAREVAPLSGEQSRRESTQRQRRVKAVTKGTAQTLAVPWQTDRSDSFLTDRSASVDGMSTQEELRTVALAQFAAVGYAATSLQQVAERAGVSKSSVLYHYASKEALLEAAIGPAIDRMAEILTAAEGSGLADRRRLLEEFVDFLLQYRLEVNIFINQGPSLVDVPVIDRANALILSLAQFFSANTSSIEEKMRFGIALGGAAYMLCTVQNLDLEIGPRDETRAALISIMSGLLAPVPTA